MPIVFTSTLTHSFFHRSHSSPFYFHLSLVCDSLSLARVSCHSSPRTLPIDGQLNKWLPHWDRWVFLLQQLSTINSHLGRDRVSWSPFLYMMTWPALCRSRVITKEVVSSWVWCLCRGQKTAFVAYLPLPSILFLYHSCHIFCNAGRKLYRCCCSGRSPLPSRILGTLTDSELLS